MKPSDVATQFCSSVKTIQPLGNGYINDTFKVETEAESFVLQKINSQVFPKPMRVMENLTRLGQHVESISNQHSTLKIPKLLLTENNQNYLLDDEAQYWRAWEYIENTESLETIVDNSQATQVGLALAEFHRLTQTLDASTLHDTLPGFHIAPQYLQQYQQVKQRTTIKENSECAAFIDRCQSIINDLEHAKAQGLLSVRTMHGDPKLNNFLFDKITGKIVSIVDLDTVKPGLIHYDIGDCLRSCCHLLDSNEFSLELCEVVLTNYLSVTSTFFSTNDYQFIYAAIRLIPFELGLRFYTDYLNGNRYFKVAELTENLERALAQFRLCSSIMKQEAEIRSIIKKL